MKIRVINESDWERTYEFDKSIIRVGSQISCDIQLAGNDIQPMLMQFVRSGGKEVKYILRIFGDNVKISRGEQVFTGQQMEPYDMLDGDKVIFGGYRLILSLEDEQTRVRTSKNMEAKMYIQKRELDVDSPINGVLRLKNIGTEKACQFRMQIRGIPDECLRSAPLPYLYPGGQSTVGFMISHLQTKPQPGFHTVSIVLTAPDDYFGETLEFRQDIYVKPVFMNEIVLEDDSAELKGFNKTAGTEAKAQEAPKPEVPFVQETARMIPGQPVLSPDVSDTDEADKPVVITGTDYKNAFAEEKDEEPEDDGRRRRSNRKQKVNVIRNDGDAFEDGPEESETAAAETVIVTPAEEKPGPEPAPVEAETEIQTVSADPKEALPKDDEPKEAEVKEAPAKRRKSSGRKKKTALPAEEEQAVVSAAVTEKTAEVSEPEQEPVTAEMPEPQNDPEPEKESESAEPEPSEAAEKAEEASPVEGPAEIPAEPEPEPETAEPEPQPEPAASSENEMRYEPDELPVVTEETLPDRDDVQEASDLPETAASEPVIILGAEANAFGEEPSEPQDSEEPESTVAEPEPLREEEEPAEDRLPETEDVPEAAEGPAVPDEEKPIEKSDEQVITSGGKKPIPVVHHNDSFDFIGEDEPDPSLSEKEPEVLFVKRGNFDE